MGINSYHDELSRAMARRDVVELKKQVERYYQDYEVISKRRKDCSSMPSDDPEAFRSSERDPDWDLALVAMSASLYDDRGFLFFVAAGPLEDLLRKPSREIVDRIVAEARKNARFRWMLTGVWLHAISDSARPHIVAAIGTLIETDPMPPRQA